MYSGMTPKALDWQKKIGKTTKPKQISLKDTEIKKFLKSYYS